jgi:hypothetical protein
MLNFSYNTSNPNTFAANNARRDMYHDLICEHQELSDEHIKLRLDLTKKGKLSRHSIICQITFLFCTSQYSFCRHILMRRHITLCRHFSATTEEQVTELVKRVKKLTGMPDSANFHISTLHFKSFNLYYCFLSSNSLNFKSL